MNRWRKTLLTSLAVVALGALTLGAGAVSGVSSTQGPDSIHRAAMPPPGPAHHRDHDVRIWSVGGGPWLGVMIEDVTGEKAKELRLESPRGALVTRVEDDSPAERAGIRKGDVIIEFEDERIPGVRTLLRLVQETPEGRTVEIQVMRDGRRVSVIAELEERPSGPGAFFFNDDHLSNLEIEIPEIKLKISEAFRLAGGRPRLGVSVDQLTPQLAEFLGVDRKRSGLFIKNVYEDTPAEAAGLKAGDVILEADDHEIESVLDLRRVLRKNAGETITLIIVRDKGERRIDVTLEEAEDDEWEEGFRLHRLERREFERALREAGRAQREAMGLHREQMRELRKLQRERLRLLPYSVVRQSGTVEI